MKLRPVFPKDEAVGCKMENIITGNDWLESYILHEWTYLIVQVEIGLDGGNI